MTEGSIQPMAAQREDHWRSYEVYQRMRVRDATTLIKPRQLSSDAYLTDPFSLVATLRENYPCYRDWPGNAFWVTRYDDVTSVFTDAANFTSRSAGGVIAGNDLHYETAINACIAQRGDAVIEPVVQRIIDNVNSGLNDGRRVDVASEFCARLPFEMLAFTLGVSPHEELAGIYLTLRNGSGWEPRSLARASQGRAALATFIDAHMIAGDFEPGSLLDIARNFGAAGVDVAATVWAMDHQTLHGSLANCLALLFSHPTQLEEVRLHRRLVKAAWLEALRHSPPIISIDMFARHEVERFGRLLPEGALVRLSSAAANRDPRVFDDPDTFRVGRRDLTLREARGQFRADGLPSAVSFGTGTPSKDPALPDDRPRSVFARTRDHAVIAIDSLLTAFPELHLADGAIASLRSLRLGGLYTCWSLPIVA